MLLAVVLVAGLWTWRRQRSVDPALQRPALQLISVPQQTQRTVAELMGHAHPSTFIAAFKRVMGTTPGAFAHDQRPSPAALDG